VDLSISSLRRQIDQSQRQKTIAQLLDNARMVQKLDSSENKDIVRWVSKAA
jgi:hypothetical protein